VSVGRERERVCVSGCSERGRERSV
jgi:hypothetical protein